MNDIIEEKGPIGAWVRKADTVFTNLLRSTSAYGAFDRIDWQFFDFIKEKGQASEDEVIEFLRFFCEKPVAMKVISRFENDDLINNKEGTIAITAKGKEVFEEVRKIQERIKEKAMEGITATDYGIAIETLKKIMDNLKEYLPEDMR